MNNVYRPDIRPGDERYKRCIPFTIVIGRDDRLVQDHIARSVYNDPSPFTVPGDHNTLKLPDDKDDSRFLVLQEVLDSAGVNSERTSVKAQQPSLIEHPSNQDVSESRPSLLVPSPPPQGVLGRERELGRIMQLLALDNEDTREIPPVALWGMGGIGKTTLAIQLGRMKGIERHFPDGVLWTAVGPQPSIRTLLDRLGSTVGIDLRPEPDEEACVERLREALSRRRVLLIVDDIWDAQHVSYFRLGGPYSRMLLTTREMPVAHLLATRRRTLQVDILSATDSLELLRRLAPEAVTVDPVHAKELCRRLEFLPLALTLAGRLLANEAEIPSRMLRLIDELIEKREARLQLLQEEGRLGLAKDQPVSLQAILGMSVERLSASDQERFVLLSAFGADPLN
jgi:hypothetical protein